MEKIALEHNNTPPAKTSGLCFRGGVRLRIRQSTPGFFKGNGLHSSSRNFTSLCELQIIQLGGPPASPVTPEFEPFFDFDQRPSLRVAKQCMVVAQTCSSPGIDVHCEGPFRTIKVGGFKSLKPRDTLTI